MHVEPRDIVEQAGRPGTAGEPDVQELGATHIPEPEGGTCIGSHAGYLDIAELDIAHMAKVEMLCRQGTEQDRLGILFGPFDRLQRGHFGRAAAFVQEGAIADLDILNGRAWAATAARLRLV